MTLDAAAELRTGVSVSEVDEVAARDNLDMLAKRFLSLSGDEFLRRRRAGALDDVEHRPGYTRVLAVATLLD
ncbi:MAG: hypothetical protein ACRDRK_08375 [Pseudonocardia sp.]